MDSHQFRPINERTVFVLCPGNLVTGGSELLHQLVGYLARNGRNARLVYTPVGSELSTPVAYERYCCPIARSIEDCSDVAVVVPEVSTEHLAGIRLARKVVWWLSVDNYAGGFGSRSDFFQYLARWLKPSIPAAATHLFQSAYAREFVLARFGCSGAMLTDYIADEYLHSTRADAARQDVVTFNPRKGFEHTRRLIRVFARMNFLPLTGMDRHQLIGALDTCKVYIDFGAHPGKDRMPREAAARGAVVIVGRRGAARFDEDMPLPASYKVGCSKFSLLQVGSLIDDIFARFSWHQTQQHGYRDCIRQERTVFESQAAYAFGVNRRVQV